ncbi:hypothetical protein ABW19_dt0201205 [Dactylella cylindrospora]|nr:hypothetical protein ABW19_dt0201205 [Dactylella cylindrospora]
MVKVLALALSPVKRASIASWSSVFSTFASPSATLSSPSASCMVVSLSSIVIPAVDFSTNCNPTFIGSSPMTSLVSTACPFLAAVASGGKYIPFFFLLSALQSRFFKAGITKVFASLSPSTVIAPRLPNPVTS